MGRTTTIRLKDHVDDRTLRTLATIMSRGARRSDPGFVEAPHPSAAATRAADEPDDELSLFRDHDLIRGGGHGFFRHNAEECRSRRIDMRSELDFDPGPLDMPEGEAQGAVLLRFGRR